MILATNTYRKFDTCVELVKSAHKGDRKPDRTWVLDNSSGMFVRYLEDNNLNLETDLHNTQVVIFPFNGGCAIAWNWLIKRALHENPDEYIVISNDDITLHTDTLSLFEKASIEHPGETVYVCGGIESPNAFSLYMVHPKTLIERVGLFDRQFKYPYCEDGDMQIRLWKAGLDLFRIPNCSVDHIGSATLKSFDQVETQQHHMRFLRNAQYLALKWGMYDHNNLHETTYNEPFNGDEDEKALALSYLKSMFGE